MVMLDRAMRHYLIRKSSNKSIYVESSDQEYQ